MAKEKNYSEIERPYNNYLERTSADYGSEGAGASGISGGATSSSAIGEKSITGAELDNLWISGWIKSRNYQPKAQGFYLDGATGYIECMDIYAKGSITGSSFHIPDQDVTANSFHVESDGDTWWGCTQTNWTADNDNATAYILKTGVAKFQSVTLSGSVVITDLQQTSISSLQGWTHNLTFSASDYNTVAWTAGAVVLSSGKTYTIGANNTGNMGAKTYIYLDPDASTTQLQTTTTYTTALGLNKILICTATPSANVNSKAGFMLWSGSGDILVDGASLAPYTVGTSATTLGWGVNLLLNKYADFEQFASAATIGTVTNGTATCDTTNYYFGTRCLKMVATSADNYVYLGSSSTNYNFPLKASTKYLVSLYVKGGAGGEQLDVQIKQDDGTLKTTTTQDVTSSWARYTFTITTDASVTNSGLLRIDNDDNGATIYIDAVQVEEASLATTPEASEWRLGAFSELHGGRITAASITASQITAHTITANEIAALTITASEIASGTITATQIATGTITTTQLSFTPLVSAGGTGAIIATINASVEGIDITADRISISGSTTFTSGYDPSQKLADSDYGVGGSYASASSGARVLVFPDANTGIQVIDDSGNDVFKALVGGTNVGDVTIGNYAGSQGLFYDKSGSSFTFKGTVIIGSGSSGIASLSDAGDLAVKDSVNLATGEVTNKTATNITYTGGATVDSLKPAEASADVTSTHTSADTSAVGGVSAATIAGWKYTGQTTIDGGDIQADTILAGSIAAAFTITGKTIQTSASANTGIKMSGSELAGYDGTNKTFSLNASTGAVTATYFTGSGAVTLQGISKPTRVYTSGDATTAGRVAAVYSNGHAYFATALSTVSANKSIGTFTEAVADNTSCQIQFHNYESNQSGLTIGSTYYLTDGATIFDNSYDDGVILGPTTTHWEAGVFDTSSYNRIYIVKVRLYRDAGATGTVKISLRAESGDKPTGSDLWSTTLTNSDIGTSAAYYTLVVDPPYDVSTSTEYCVVIGMTALGGVGNFYIVPESLTPPNDAKRAYSDDSGATWSTSATRALATVLYEATGQISTTAGSASKIIGQAQSATEILLQIN